MGLRNLFLGIKKSREVEVILNKNMLDSPYSKPNQSKTPKQATHHYFKAFPFELNDPTVGYESSHGMDLRTYIATAAMQGMLSACNGVDSNSQSKEWIAKISVTQADALIAELQKQK